MGVCQMDSCVTRTRYRYCEACANALVDKLRADGARLTTAKRLAAAAADLENVVRSLRFPARGIAKRPPQTVVAFPPPGEGRAAEMLSAIAAALAVRVEDLRGGSQSAPIVYARHLAMAAMCALLPGVSLLEIGRAMARHHSTVMYGRDRAQAWPLVVERLVRAVRVKTEEVAA
jgi:hypothetical protein